MAQPLKLGLVGTDIYQAVCFTELFQGATLPPEQQIPGARIVAFWSKGETREERRWAEELREKCGVATQVERPEELIGIVDAILITTGRRQDHRALAEPFLKAHVPIFVRKPLADNLEEARAILALAEKEGTPLCSHSALRYAPTVTALTSRLPHIGPLGSGICAGPGELSTYGIHIVEMLHTIFGSGVQWVQSVHNEDKDVAMVWYGDGKSVGLHLVRYEMETFECSYFSVRESGHIVVSIPTPRCLFYREMLQVVLEMFRTGCHPLALSQILEVMTILEAIRRSAESGRRVYLRELLPHVDGQIEGAPARIEN